jgi:hypothetical protein
VREDIAIARRAAVRKPSALAAASKELEARAASEGWITCRRFSDAIGWDINTFARALDMGLLPTPEATVANSRKAVFSLASVNQWLVKMGRKPIDPIPGK